MYSHLDAANNSAESLAAAPSGSVAGDQVPTVEHPTVEQQQQVVDHVAGVRAAAAAAEVWVGGLQRSELLQVQMDAVRIASAVAERLLSADER